MSNQRINLINRMQDIADKINSGHYGRSLPGGFTAKVVRGQSIRIKKGTFDTCFMIQAVADFTDDGLIGILKRRYAIYCDKCDYKDQQ